MSINSASLINFTTILISVKDVSQFNIKNFYIKNGELILYVENCKIRENTVTIFLKGEVNIKRECRLYYESEEFKVSYLSLYSSEDFSKRYDTSEELGCYYTPSFSTFTLWSPAASYVNLLIYQLGEPSIKENPRKFKMVEEQGLWKVKVKGNLKGYYYTYQLKIFDEINEAVDPYARAVGINGCRGAIIDLESTKPKGFNRDIANRLFNYTDAIIYEASIRDISMHPDSGIRNRGRFLGLIEEDTSSSKGVGTGLKHIKELGVTHLQLMPIFDFSAASIDEKNPYKYNWGYDPINFNVPEGSYSTDPYCPSCRITELKRLVQQLHRNHICVVMDVVYNHLYHNTENNFHKIFPGYYFRHDSKGNLSDGSGCGNDTATERPMMRRFIIDSVLYWAREYHIDGFRLDLMGIMDITTVNELRLELNKLDPRIMLYGEGWNLNTELPEDQRASLRNAGRLPRIGHFNDTFRDIVRGSVFSVYDKGFVSGKPGLEDTLRYCITACTHLRDNSKATFAAPDQSVNYTASHDNHTLWDKLEMTCPESPEEEIKAMSVLADSIVLTSQGIPFLHSGSEFCRTKGGISNSYNSTDAVNRLDWNRKLKYLDVFEYYKGLITLRKEHPAFRMTTGECIREHLVFLPDTPPNTVGFLLINHANHDSWKDILVIYNGNKHGVRVNIPEKAWNLVADKKHAGTEVLNSFEGHDVYVESISMIVLYSMNG